MPEEQEIPEAPAPPAAEPASAPPAADAAPPAAKAEPVAKPPAGQRPPQQGQNKGNRDNRPPNREGKGRPEGRGDRPPNREGRPGGPPNREGRPGGRFDLPPEIDLDKLVADSLYLDNQAHAVVSRIREMDSGTRSQLRRFYNAVRRATSTPESERQHQFVMLRARLAYTIARHGLRSLDQLERLLLQVTRKNEARGYERFRDLFEAIVAYNE